MKKNKTYLLIIAFLVSNVSAILAHKQPTHQYILQEAYKLLKLQLDRPDFGINGDGQADTWIGNLGNARNHNPWEPRTMGGIWCEDEWDAVFKYGTLTGPIPSVDLVHESFVSVTHFWQPDYRNSRTKLHTGGITFIDCPNALHKALMYTYGQDQGEDWEMRLILGNGDAAYLKSKSILDLFNSTQFYVKRQYDYLARQLDGNPYWRNFGDVSQGRTFCYNILGRVAHLLGDMSVPAHVHQDEHGTISDNYEENMTSEDTRLIKFPPIFNDDDNDGQNDRVTYWTAEKIFEEKGGFINPYCNPLGMFPIEYLMYTTAQISDHFASNRLDGNDSFTDIGEIKSRINDDYNGNNTVSDPGPTTTSDYLTVGTDLSLLGKNIDAIRDATFPYVIRATAGLLYWFLTETHQINPNSRCQNYVNILGKTLRGQNYMLRAGGDEAGKITAGASSTVNTIIESTAKNVTFKASEEIKLLPGFDAKSGCEFSAFIGPCDDCSYEEANPFVVSKN